MQRGPGLDDAALCNGPMLAVVNHMTQLGAKSLEVRKLALDFREVKPRNPVNIGARLLTVVREAKQLPHLVE